MAGFFSKASSFLSSQANDQKSPSHSAKGAGSNEEETCNSLSSHGGYGDLLAGAQKSISSLTEPSDGESIDKHEDPHKAPPSSGAGGYGDLLETAQSFMATSKPSAAEGGKPDIKKEVHGADHKAADSGGYGDLLASAQEMMGSTKIGGGESKNVADVPKTTSSSGDPSSGDMYASAQVLMGAFKSSREGGAADMGEVAGATANLIGAGTRYGDLDKTPYGEYAHKAQTYLEDYKTSHAGKASHKLPSSTDDQDSSLPVGSKPETPVKFGGNNEEKEEVGSNPPLKTRSTEEEYN